MPTQWGRGTYGQGAGLGALDTVFADMQASKRQREAEDRAYSTAQQQRDAEMRARLLAAYMQNPDANTRRILTSQGISVPELQLTPQQEAEVAIANARKGLAGVPLDPFQQQVAATTLLTDKVPNQQFTEITGARNYMDPAVFKTYMNEGGTPANVVEKNKAAAFKDVTEGQFNQGPRVRVADASAAASRASAAESYAGAGLKNAQTVREKNAITSFAPVTAASGEEKPAPLVQMLLEYRYDPKLLRRMKAEEQEAIAREAQRFDPTFDMAHYESRQQTKNDFSKGKAANNIRALNTAVHHIHSLSEALKNLDNSSFQPWNAVANWTAEKTGSGNVTKADMTINASVGELASLFKGTGATDQEIHSWRGPIHRNLSKEQGEDAVKMAIELLAGRLSALADQYEAGMNKPKDFSILSPESRKVLTSMGVDVNAIDRNVKAPAGAKESVAAPAAGKVIKFDLKGNKVQ